MGKLRTAVRRISSLAVPFLCIQGYTLFVYATSVATSLSHAVIYSLDNLNCHNHCQFQVYISVRPSGSGLVRPDAITSSGSQ